MGLLDGKIAVVTGAGRGVGRACAMAFAREGARVALLARTQGDVEQAAEEIRRQGGVAIGLAADVGTTQAVESAFSAVERDLGLVDILVNNAAILGPAERVADVDPQAWSETYRINVWGSMLCARRALPAMMERHAGKIVNVSSGAALVPIGGYTAYTSSKAAILHFTVCLAEEVKSYGINVNSVGVWARTAMWEDQLRDAPMPAVEEAAASGWTPAPEENLGAVLFLASCASDHVTGQYLAANSLPDHARRRNPARL